jgi:multidrug efflux pump subunit AcrB
VQELFPAVVGSSLATLVIHIPFAFLGGVAGAFFAALSITMVFALSISFLFSVLLAPLLAATLLTGKDIAKAVANEQRSSHWLLHRYEYVLRKLLRHKWLAIPVILLLVLGGVLLFQRVGTGFMPEMDEGSFVLDYWTPPGTSLEETDRMLLQVEEILQSTPEILNYGRRTGAELGFFVTETNTGDILVKLKNKRNRSIFAVIDEVRTRIESSQPAMIVEFGQQMQDVIGDLTNNPQPVEIKIFGNDKSQLTKLALQIEQILHSIPGITDIYNGITISGSSILIQVDPAKAAQAGLTVQEVQDQLTSMIKGVAETYLQRGEKLIGIRTRYDAAYRGDLHAIRQLQLQSPDSFQVALASVAEISTTKGQAQIERENLKQLIAVTARIEGSDLGGTVNEIKKKLKNTLALPVGVTLDYGGTYKTQQESFRGLLMVLGAAVLFVFIVLLFEFESFRVPFTVFLINLPSVFGVILALYLMGSTFNISSFVGAILVVGIVAENAIFLLHYIVRYLKDGMALDEALVQASLVRVRPILMTTFAAVFALLPLALNIGSGTQMQQPLAIAVIGGFSVSTLLLMFVLPQVYGLLGKKPSNARDEAKG